MRAVILLSFLCIASFTWAQSQGNDRQKPNEKAKQDLRGAQERPLVIEGIPAQKSETETREQREYRAKQASIGASVSKALDGLEHESVLTTRLTLGLFLVAFFQVIMFGVQLWMMRDNLKDARTAAIAARQSAKSTKASVQVMEDTAKRQLRAYLSYKPELPIQIPTLEQWHVTGMKFRIQNDGQTPAYDLRQVTVIGLRERNLNVVLHPVAFEDDGSKLVLNPGMHSEQVMKTTAPIPEADIARFRSGTHAIYVWGEARYRDAFGTNHTSKYSFQITGEGAVSGNIHWCATGNEST